VRVHHRSVIGTGKRELERFFSGLGLVLLSALVAAVAMAAAGAAATPRVTSVSLPTGATFWSVERDGANLLLTGTARTGGGCAWATVEPKTLHVIGVARGTCERPLRAAHRLVPALFRDPRSFDVRVRIAKVQRERRVSYGPVVMRFEEASDTHLEWTHGTGSLWLFDAAMPRGAEALRISTATGAVVQSVRMPRIFRPLLAADEDGLWLAIATNGSAPGSAAAPIYRIAAGAAHAPALVRRAGRAALWLVADGHTVWVDVVAGTSRQEVWRLEGRSGRAVALTAARGLGGGPAVLEPGTETLWILSDVLSSGRPPACRGERITTVDGRTGRTTQVAVLRVPGGSCLYPETGSTAFAFGAFYVVDAQARPSRLYRIAG
jgi:hypothetical protein